ncbi:SpoIIE family protein phosphatase, partial [Actinotalea sp. C106]|uniref:SpoIIE family protein phosphatase n=1 Tax=Actinotalea sp. C106 TaxID=2908644 RepID=UPI00202812E8
PLLAPADGAVLGALGVHATAERSWTPAEVDLLGRLAAPVVTQIEQAALWRDLRASRARSDLALAAAGIGSFDWDLTTGHLVWDERLTVLFGYTPEEFVGTIEEFEARLHPEDLPHTREALFGAIAACGDYDAEYRVVRPDGSVRRVEARGRALPGLDGAAVRVIGAAYDTTDLREGEARVARILESMTTAFFSVDRQWRFSYVNRGAEALLGLPREKMLGNDLWELFPLALGSTFEREYRGAMDSGRPTAFEAYYPPPLDRWYEVRAWPDVDGLAVYFHDITERRADEARIRLAVARSELIAAVASELAGTLDAHEAVGRLAQLVVPTLAAWCIVSLVEQDRPGPEWRRLKDLGSWHEDPARRVQVERYAALRLGALRGPSFVAQTLASGEPTVSREGAAEAIAAMLEPGEAHDLLLELAPEDVVVLPLRAQGRTLGLLSLYGVAGRAGFAQVGEAEPHLGTALDVASRAALALDNARLYTQQRQVAETLQRSLLTEPPQVDGLEIAVRYQPAAEAARVGGDWYDAFVAQQDVTTLVIGDVVGHDLEAAAAMGQARALLRGIAATTGEDPASVLRRLDESLDVLEAGLAATVLVANLVRTPEDRALHRARLCWSSAGHPPPLVLTPDGDVVELGATGRPDLLLGVDHRRSRVDHESEIAVGSTLVLFTDGLFERRDEGYRAGLERLRSVLGGLADLGVEDLCDALLEQLVPERPTDDVALAVVRLRDDRA